MLEGLLEAYGYTNRRAARESGVSATSIARYIRDEAIVPSLTTASALAALFNDDDAAALLESWGFDRTAEHVRSTHDPEVANGWRLDSLLAELRETNKLLRRLVALSEPTYPSPKESDNATTNSD